MFENMGVNVLITVFVNSFNQPPAYFTIVIFVIIGIRANNTIRQIMLVFFTGFLFDIELLVPKFVPFNTNATSSCSGKSLVMSFLVI